MNTSSGRTVIKPLGGWLPVNLMEMWEYRELLSLFVRRDIKVRYKQTALGASWALIQPVANTFAFTVFFGRLAKIPSEGVPYILFSLSGLVLWSSFFTPALTQTASSVVSSGSVISKIYFPRLLAPLATATSYLVDLAVAVCLLVVVVLAYGRGFPVQVVLAPLFVLLTFITALGVGLWLAALNVRYRDVRFVVGFMTQLWLLASPIAYPSSLLHGWKRVIYGINPMASAIDGFRWCVLNTPPPPLGQIAASIAIAIAILVGGLFYFRRAESTFVDIM